MTSARDNMKNIINSMFDLSTPSITGGERITKNRIRYVKLSKFPENQKMPIPMRNKIITMLPNIFVWLSLIPREKRACHILG